MERLDDVLKRSGWTTPTGSPRGDASSPSARGALPGAGRPDCPRCRGVGFVYPQLPDTDPEYGLAVQCQCIEEELEEHRVDRLQRYSNLGPLVRMTFDSISAYGRSGLPANQQQFGKVLEAAIVYAEDPQGWMVLQGPGGSGKTHLAAAVANARIARGEPVLFMVVPDLLDHLRATFAPQNPDTYDELFEQVRKRAPSCAGRPGDPEHYPLGPGEALSTAEPPLQHAATDIHHTGDFCRSPGGR